jgi:hypothetical protein
LCPVSRVPQTFASQQVARRCAPFSGPPRLFRL